MQTTSVELERIIGHEGPKKKGVSSTREGLTPIYSDMSIATQNTPPIPSILGLWARDKPSTASIPSRITVPYFPSVAKETEETSRIMCQ